MDSAVLALLAALMALSVALAALRTRASSSGSCPVAWSGEPFEQQASSGIPRILWTYWDGPRPPVVDDCIESWRQLNPSYEVRVLGRADAEALGVDKLRWAVGDPVRLSDFLRLELLQRYGGVWFDASVLATAPIDWVQAAYHSVPGGAQLVAYSLLRSTTHPRWPVIENWFLAAPQGSEFVRAWNAEFRRINDFDTIAAYLAAVQAAGVTLQAITDPSYLAQHVAAQVVMQGKQPGDSDWARRLALFEAERGPFRYLADGGWSAERAVLLLCAQRDTYAAQDAKMVKFPRNERNVLVNNPALARCVLPPPRGPAVR